MANWWSAGLTRAIGAQWAEIGEEVENAHFSAARTPPRAIVLRIDGDILYDRSRRSTEHDNIHKEIEKRTMKKHTVLMALMAAVLMVMACSPLGGLLEQQGTEEGALSLPPEQASASPTPPLAPAAPDLSTSGPGLQGPPQLAGCPIFPADNVWNTPVDTLPVDANSDAYVATIGAEDNIQADFGSGDWPEGSGAPIGIPYVVVDATQETVAVSFDYDDESDSGPYPLPAGAPIEGGPDGDGDRHVLVLDRDNCLLYELFYAFPEDDGSWNAGSGAIFDLNSNALRPEGWTSADAAGLPVLAGLVRYDEVAEGEITHALRFTAPETRREYLWPARHYASDLTGDEYPPLGQRFRLRADFDISGFSPEVQIILRALKRYGMILADNGSSWFISGVPDERWDNDALGELRQVQGSDFEAVDVSSLIVDPDSGQAQGPTLPAPTPSSTEVISAPAGGGHITYQLPDGHVYRIEARDGAVPEDISLALNRLAAGSEDGQLNISPDGEWLVLNTDRFDPECVGWACLAIVPSDLSVGEAVRSNGQVIHPEGSSAVASGGNLIVYPSGDGPHDLDLWSVTRGGGNWGAPVLLTGDSPYAWNSQPAISADGTKVIFDCGDEAYGQEGTSLCEVGTGGMGFRVALTPAQGPGGSPQNALHHPDYAPDGSIVFEADWEGEQIWRLPLGATDPVRLTAQFDNDNSPCVLPDGRVVSLWLLRPGGSGFHEIKAMALDGSSYIMVVTDEDVFDVGIGCGE